MLSKVTVLKKKPLTIQRQHDTWSVIIPDPDANARLIEEVYAICAEFNRQYPEDQFTSRMIVPRTDQDPPYHARLQVGPAIWADEEFWRRIVLAELQFG
jgi:hypothetical protein